MLQVKKIYINSDKFDGTNKCLQTKPIMGLVKMLGWFDKKVAMGSLQFVGFYVLIDDSEDKIFKKSIKYHILTKFEAEDIEKLQFMGMYQNESIWFDSLCIE